MNIFKKIFNYFTEPLTTYHRLHPSLLENQNVNPVKFDVDYDELSKRYDERTDSKLYESVSGDVSNWKVPKKLPLRDSRGRFTKQKEENV